LASYYKTSVMKTAKILAITCMGLFGLSVTMSSCNKDVEATATAEETTASDSQEASAVGDEASNVVDAAANGGNLFGRFSSSAGQLDAMSGCATVTRDTLGVNSYRITVDFGTVNCLCADGKNRRGKIIATFTGDFWATGGVKTITFDNFYRNDNKVEGTRTVTNQGPNSSGNYTWKIEAANMRVTRTDGRSHTWNSTRVREMLAGYDTRGNWSDDEYQITGTATGSNSSGVSYTANITTPLHRKLSCRWIDKGVIEFTNSNGKTRTLDYGDGTCDDQATVVVTGRRGRTVTRTITLR